MNKQELINRKEELLINQIIAENTKNEIQTRLVKTKIIDKFFPELVYGDIVIQNLYIRNGEVTMSSLFKPEIQIKESNGCDNIIEFNSDNIEFSRSSVSLNLKDSDFENEVNRIKRDADILTTIIKHKEAILEAVVNIFKSQEIIDIYTISHNIETEINDIDKALKEIDEVAHENEVQEKFDKLFKVGASLVIHQVKNISFTIEKITNKSIITTSGKRFKISEMKRLIDYITIQ